MHPLRRFASSPSRGTTPCGPAKPVPRCVLEAIPSSATHGVRLHGMI